MARILIRNATLLAGAPWQAAESQDLLIDGDLIAGIGAGIEAPDADVIDASGLVAMPGLVDAHLHTWQTGIRAIAGDWSLSEYFTWVHLAIAPKFTPEDIYLANLVGALNQINAGITTLFDWNHNNPTPEHSDRAVDGLADAGIRAVYGHGMARRAAAGGEEPLHPEDEVKRLLEGRIADEPLLSMALAIRGPDQSSYETTVHDIELARKYGLIASSHNGGRLPKGRKTPDGLLRLAREGRLGPDFNSVHSNKLSDEEIDVMADAGVSFTATPEVEMQMGHGIPVTGLVIARGLQPSIGIDIETEIGSEMLWAARFALQLERGLENARMHARGEEVESLSLSTGDALDWATIAGARALRMEGEIGTLEAGKKADITMFRTGDLNLFAAADAPQGVLYHGHSGNVDTVIIGGRVMKRGGRLLRDDLDRLKSQLAESGRRILSDAGWLDSRSN